MAVFAHIDFEVPGWGEWPAAPELRRGYRSEVLADAPLAYWRLGETAAGDAVADHSGHGHHGSMEGGLALGASGALRWDRDTAFAFDGGTAAVRLPETLTLPVGSPITMALWVRTEASEARQGMAFTLGDQDAPNRCSAHIPWEDGRLYWDYGDLGAGRVSLDFTPHLGQWTHVALVSAGINGAFKAIYLDGALAKSLSASAGPGIALSGGWLGRNDFSGGGMFHEGELDEVAVFDRVLSAERIGAQYRAGVGR